jgi:hypothetical protein
LLVELLQTNRSQEEVEQLKDHIFSARAFFERGKASGSSAMSKIADHGLAIIASLFTLFEEREQGSPVISPPGSVLRQIANLVGDRRLNVIGSTSKAPRSERKDDMPSDFFDGTLLASGISDFHPSLATIEAPALDLFLTDTARWFESVSETGVGRSGDAAAANEVNEGHLNTLYELGLAGIGVQSALY